MYLTSQNNQDTNPLKNLNAGVTVVPAYTPDDLYVATDLLVVLLDPASSPDKRKVAEQWERETLFTLPVELRRDAMRKAKAVYHQRQGV
jgi:hypothetical protein